MHKLLIGFLMSGAILAGAQSKKELQAEIDKLRAEIAELKKPKPVSIEVESNKASYCLGVLMAQNVKRQSGDSLNAEIITAGFSDAFSNGDLKISEQDASQFFQQYMQGLMERKAQRAKAEGIAFLADNKSKDGVTVTNSGLQYKVLKAGTGKTPSATDKVTVHYTGKLTDGTVFDSSVQRGSPATFDVGGVIRGWTEALQLMKEGDVWELYIPSELAYGERGAGGQIPPHATLIFEVELIKVN